MDTLLFGYILGAVITFGYNVLHSEYGVVGEEEPSGLELLYLFALAVQIGLALLWPIYWLVILLGVWRGREE